ncbi:MAG: zinc ABC transporter substrate-binding protein [Clostridia bacterium]|nr:zinc ABC transporter substrate-binding protein [Clostridia bacterium]
MKKMMGILLVLAITLSCLMGGAALADEKKLSVVVTIFPIYDWVHETVGDSGNAEITLLLDSGVDLHSYQPTAQDILKISTADLFIYVGGESDAWVQDVLASAMNPGLKAINLVEAMGEDIKMEEVVEGMEHEHDEPDESHDEDHDEEDHEHEEADEHVWLSLRNAQKLVQVIAGALGGMDADHAEAYRANAGAYIEKLAALDARYAEITENAEIKTILFGDRFPFRYLADDYGLTYYAAFSGCSAESEASFQTIVFLAQKVDELGLPAVLTIEHPKTRIAETVVQATAARNQKILAMDSMQGTTARDIQDGVTYLSVMESNLDVLREALTK